MRPKFLLAVAALAVVVGTVIAVSASADAMAIS